MDSNNNAQLEKEKEMGLHSDSSTSTINSEKSTSSPESLNLSKEEDNINREQCPIIMEVYASNLKQEMKKIKSIIRENKYTYIGMDTEFPGIIKNLNNLTNDFYYKTMKLNVESTKLIQIGIALSDENGDHPKNYPYYTWQFNFKFDLEKDKFSEESINLLKNSGIDFENLKNNGIDFKDFAKELLNSSLILNPDVKWISFQGSYDFAYLLNLVYNEGFPKNEKKFIETLTLYFPEYYDVRMLVKDTEKYFYGGLNKLIYTLGIERKGINHQAGSDSIATIEAFHKLIKNGIITKTKLKTFKNVLYGIGIGKDDENTIKYIYNSNDKNVNNINVNNINKTNIPKNTVLNRNMMYYQNQINQMNNKCNNYAKCYYPCIFVNAYNLMKNNLYQMTISRAMMA